MNHSNRIFFTKMHGLGNDFVIIDASQKPCDAKKLPIVPLANRYTGIGFNQILIIEPSKKADFFCRIFNSDGSEAEQCGNGLRCVARYIHEKKLISTRNFHLETKAGIFPIVIKDYEHICLTLDALHIEHSLIELKLMHPLKKIPVSILSLGNPHVIFRVESIHSSEIEELAPLIKTHSLFPNGINIGFMQIVDRHHILLRTFERGAGETHACGSNASAAVCAGIHNGWLDQKVNVRFRYGCLEVIWKGEANPVSITGPATFVFEGEIRV